MSGPTVGRALQKRFEAVRRAELDRLRRKLGALSDDDRQSAEAIIADVIAALAREPAYALARTAHPHTLRAVVELFDLEAE